MNFGQSYGRAVAGSAEEVAPTGGGQGSKGSQPSLPVAGLAYLCVVCREVYPVSMGVALPSGSMRCADAARCATVLMESQSDDVWPPEDDDG